MTENLLAGEDWAPPACTLPTVDQPLRRAEFDAMSPQRLRLELRAHPDAASRAAGLAVKETGCCSFFHFDLSIGAGNVVLTVSTDPSNAAVLAALGERAAARVGAHE
jgi:hypothetical protein